MMDKLFHGLFDNAAATVIPVTDFLLCVGISLGLGLVLALTGMYRSRSTRSFLMTLALLPRSVSCVPQAVYGA